MAPAKQPPGGNRGARATGDEGLPYRIELWDGEAVERVLALTGSASLARAIYAAARVEYPDRVIVLSLGNQVLAPSASEEGTQGIDDADA